MSKSNKEKKNTGNQAVSDGEAAEKQSFIRISARFCQGDFERTGIQRRRGKSGPGAGA